MLKFNTTEAAWNRGHDLTAAGYGSFYFDNGLDESDFDKAIFEAAVNALIETLIDSGKIFDGWNNKTVLGDIILYDSYRDRMTVIDEDTLRRFNAFYHMAIKIAADVLVDKEDV